MMSRTLCNTGKVAVAHQAKRRVLVVVTHPLGGIRTYLLNNLRFLREQGYVFTFMGPSGEAFRAFREVDIRGWPDAEFVEIRNFGSLTSVASTVARTIKIGNVALIHSQGLRAGFACALATHVRYVPHVITLHDTINPVNRIAGRMAWLKKRFVGSVTRRVDVIVAVSHDCAASYREYLASWKKANVQVIPNGVDVGALLTDSDQISQASQQPDSVPLNGSPCVAGFFGRFMPEKGFLQLLDALRILATNGFAESIRVLATKDPHGYRREYMKAVEEDSTLSQMIRFTDPVPHIGTLLQQIDILVMPSLWEACPLLPMEAMCMGVPVVGSDAIGLREVLRDTPSFMPKAGDAAELALAIQHAMDSSVKQRAADFAQIARKRFDNRYAADRLQQLYGSLIAASRS